MQLHESGSQREREAHPARRAWVTIFIINGFPLHWRCRGAVVQVWLPLCGLNTENQKPSYGLIDCLQKKVMYVNPVTERDAERRMSVKRLSLLRGCVCVCVCVCLPWSYTHTHLRTRTRTRTRTHHAHAHNSHQRAPLHGFLCIMQPHADANGQTRSRPTQACG